MIIKNIAGFTEADDPGNMTDEEVRMWAKYYLIARAELLGEDPCSITEKDIDIFALKCRISTPVSRLSILISFFMES